MIIYNYDEITKVYTGESEAALDPEETKKQGKEVYLIPDFSTTNKPPKAKKNEIVIYNNGWEIVPDYRGSYMVDNNMQPEEITEFGELPEGFVVITEAQALKIKEDSLFYVISDGKLIENPDYEEQKQAKEEEEFNKQFFVTSLGYVRRNVTMKDGSIRNFLSDILPLLEVGVEILTYSRELEQSKVAVTKKFLTECKQQVLVDFYGGV